MAGITQTSLSSLFFNKSDSKPILTLGLNRYGDIVKESNRIENNVIIDTTISSNNSTTSLTSGINPNTSNAFFSPFSDFCEKWRISL